jgi:hypothetical protein
VSDEDLMPGKTKVDGDVEVVPVAVMVAGQLDDDVTGNDAVEKVLELLDAKPDMGGQGVRVRHASERELKGNLHWKDLLPPRKARFVRAAPFGSRRVPWRSCASAVATTLVPRARSLASHAHILRSGDDLYAICCGGMCAENAHLSLACPAT